MLTLVVAEPLTEHNGEPGRAGQCERAPTIG